jgi:hypothetical protein
MYYGKTYFLCSNFLGFSVFTVTVMAEQTGKGDKHAVW